MPSGRSATSRARSTPAATTRRTSASPLPTAVPSGSIRSTRRRPVGSSRSAPASDSRWASSRCAARSRPSVEVKTTPQPSASPTASAIAARSPPSSTMCVSAVWSASARSQRGDRLGVAYQVLAHFCPFPVKKSHRPSLPRADSVWRVISACPPGPGGRADPGARSGSLEAVDGPRAGGPRERDGDLRRPRRLVPRAGLRDRDPRALRALVDPARPRRVRRPAGRRPRRSPPRRRRRAAHHPARRPPRHDRRTSWDRPVRTGDVPMTSGLRPARRRPAHHRPPRPAARPRSRPDAAGRRRARRLVRHPGRARRARRRARRGRTPSPRRHHPAVRDAHRLRHARRGPAPARRVAGRPVARPPATRCSPSAPPRAPGC